MLLVLWAGLVGASLVAGASFAGLLSTVRERESLAVLACTFAVAAGALCLNAIIQTYHAPSAILAAGLIVLGSLVGGYGLVAALLGYLKHEPEHVHLPDPGNPPRILALLLAEVEPEKYEPAFAKHRLTEMAEAGVSGTNMIITPILFAALKARYRAAGGSSPELAQARSIVEKIEAMLDNDEFVGPLLVRCLDGTSLPNLVSAAAQSGYRGVVSAGVDVGESYGIDREKCGVDALRLDESDFPVVYAQPLWASDRLAEMVADRILAVATEPQRTGVALVLHGQPAKRERTHSVFDVHESAFANRIRLLITEAGIDSERIRLCWADWIEPGIATTVRHLAALDCARVLVVPCCHPFENLNTLLDFPVEIKRARVPDSVHVVQLSPWKDDPSLAGVLVEAIENVSREIAGTGS